MNNLLSYLDNETVDYYKWLSQYGLFTYEQKIINSYFPKGSLVLDIGCGAGRTTVGLHSLGFQVRGIDYSETMIEKAKENYPDLVFSVQNVLDLEFPDNSFDCAIFSFNGLMLVGEYTDRLKALSEIMRVDNGINENKRFYDLSEEERELLLHSKGDIKYKIQYKAGGRTRSKTTVYIGPITGLELQKKDMFGMNAEKYSKPCLCPKCQGSRLSADIGTINIIKGISVNDFLTTHLEEVEAIIKRLPVEKTGAYSRDFILRFIDACKKLNIS